jgi:hypothetical protein
MSNDGFVYAKTFCFTVDGIESAAHEIKLWRLGGAINTVHIIQE